MILDHKDCNEFRFSIVRSVTSVSNVTNYSNIMTKTKTMKATKIMTKEILETCYN